MFEIFGELTKESAGVPLEAEYFCDLARVERDVYLPKTPYSSGVPLQEPLPYTVRYKVAECHSTNAGMLV